MRAIVLYGVMIMGAVGLFLLIDGYGQNLTAPYAAAPTATASVAEPSAIVHVLLTLTAVVALGWLLGQVFRFLSQPPVIGEVVAGIVNG